MLTLLKNFTKTALAQCTVLAMAASLVTVPPLNQVNGKRVQSGESQVVNDKDWGYVLRSEPQTLGQCLNFSQYHSRTLQKVRCLRKFWV